MKKTVRMLLLVLSIACLLSSCALLGKKTEKTDSQGLVFHIVPGSGTYGVALGEKEDVAETIKIPAEYGGIAVTSILQDAFRDCKNLKSVTIPESVTSIEKGAFYGCEGLTSISIPKEVTVIEEDVFYNCSGLQSVTIPDRVTEIGERAFYGCKGLTSLFIPKSVTVIGKDAFAYSSTSLEHIEVDEDNPEYAALGNCLIEKVTKTLILGCKTSEIPKDSRVNTIGIRAFAGCSTIKTILIPSTIKRIGDEAFIDCTGIESLGYNKDAEWGVKDIGEKAFYGCTSLKRVKLPKTVRYIGDMAFYDCTKLESIEYDGSVEGFREATTGRDWNFSVRVACENGYVEYRYQ